MAVSMSDVARHAGVSQRTVSNVVNNYVHVSPATRARVQASLDALGYRPNTAARRLRTGRTGTVTLAVPTFRERYFADLAEAVVSAARERSTTVLVETTGGRHETELELLRGGGEILTDGVIMSAVSLGRTDQRSSHPVVLIGDREPGSAIDHVGIKNREAAQAAVTHLLDAGRRRILLLGANHGPRRSYQLRRQGYQAALKKYGIEPDPELVVECDWTTAAAADAVTALLAERALPDGIFAMNDSAALGALRALVRAGIDVPGQVSVIGFDDIVEAGLSTPSLSTVAPLLDDIASMALDLLEEQLDEDHVPQHRMAGYELRVRESTGR
ncbi:LacI family transcriptional regulator [Kribbella sp. VKM Ac-2569]|uniref:LacI family DNA-binding transcriptional regulator n=1 Tax=Kribbella sp. VKM Ac-2569 TaxID=2512220 RepID=UPI00102BEE73|nr:LacI family DNA-binding transcriptional regulator [Kribbella sp. VKM Ac-2569]RZT07628.1 LacI family transcriptional regulator [Kribbella sp. VKM Ac-2569]